MLEIVQAFYTDRTPKMVIVTVDSMLKEYRGLKKGVVK